LCAICRFLHPHGCGKEIDLVNFSCTSRRRGSGMLQSFERRFDLEVEEFSHGRCCDTPECMQRGNVHRSQVIKSVKLLGLSPNQNAIAFVQLHFSPGFLVPQRLLPPRHRGGFLPHALRPFERVRV
jgi:hypothetical protein